MNRKIVTAFLAIGVAIGVSSCDALSKDYDPGHPGRVIEKDHDTNGKRPDDYDLTTQWKNKNGELVTDEFEVSKTHYDRCYEGSKYPLCTTLDR